VVNNTEFTLSNILVRIPKVQLAFDG
jgi:hypothetical protein